MSEEISTTSNITFTNNPNGSPFANTVTASSAPVNYSTGDGWYGAIPPTGPTPITLTTGNVHANISPTDIDRIADVVLAKIDLRIRTEGRKLGRKVK